MKLSIIIEDQLKIATGLIFFKPNRETEIQKQKRKRPQKPPSKTQLPFNLL